MDGMFGPMSGTRESLINPIPRHPGESRDPVTFVHPAEMQKRWVTRRIPRLALRAIGCADVRSGILPPQSGYRFATAFAGLQKRTPKAARSVSAMDGASILG
jgi:hypothetical protein